MACIFNPVLPLSKGAATQASLQERPFASNKRDRASAALFFLFAGGVLPKSMQMITASPAVPVTI